MTFKKGDRVRLSEKTIPADHPWRKPYNGRFGSGFPAATHGTIKSVCRTRGFVRFKPTNRKTVQTIHAGCLELDPDYRMTIPELVAENEAVLGGLEKLGPAQLTIDICGACPYASHSGAFTPGGARPICGHPGAVQSFAGDVEGDAKYRWEHRVIDNRQEPPAKCPIRRLEADRRSKSEKAV